MSDDVWIADKCYILKGERIHNYAVIGAQSLVKNEILENAIAVGTPAKVINERQ